MAIYGSNPSLNTKIPTPFGVGIFVVGEDGFEPSKRNVTDLQSAPCGLSGTPPVVELAIGIEPTTC